MTHEPASVAIAMNPKLSPGPRCSALGLIMAVLALLGQIAVGAIVPYQDRLPVQASFADVPICHSELPDSSDGQAPTDHSRHGMPCALCPVCHALTATLILPGPAVVLPVSPATPLARLTLLPPARAPPAAAVLAATYPTGPPSLA